MNAKVLHYDQPITLEQGETLKEVDIAYHTYGALNEKRDNVIWVCHALTGNSDVCDWWSGLFGKGKLFDPRKYFIVCSNMLGSNYGSTNPLSTNPDTGRPYYGTFPEITVRDMVQLNVILRKHLGIDKIFTALGGSMGGHNLLEWLIMDPGVCENAFLVATNHIHSPWGIAFNESQRMAIQADSTFGEDRPDAGANGLKAARSIALLSYRNANAYNTTQMDVEPLYDGYKAASYQQYQGNKLLMRFNAYSYWALSKAMDSFNVGRGRGSAEEALEGVTTRCLVMGIDSDILFPPKEQVKLAALLPNARFVSINSGFGHDGFLIEYPQIVKHLRQFLNI